MAWSNSLQTFAWIFPVGRGNAAFLRNPLNQGFILDMAGGDFEDPATFVRKHFVPHLDKYRNQHIAQAILSHPHIDHITQCAELEHGDLHPSLLTCPHDKDPDEAIDWNRICNPEGSEKIIATYRRLFERRNPPLQTICHESNRAVPPNLEYGIYWVRPPVCHKLHPSDDNHYGNGTSIVFYLRHGSHSILFPGDITPDCLDAILEDREGVEKRFTRFDNGANTDWHTATVDQPSLGELLAEHGLTVLIAPHHGLESCYSTPLYQAIRGERPQLVIVSERRRSHERDGNTDCRYTGECGGSGVRVSVDGQAQQKRFLSTKVGHHILIVFAGTGQPRIYMDTRTEPLMAILNAL